MFPHQNPVRTSCISHTCPNHTHLILLDVITQIILGVAWQTNHKAPRYAVFSKPATSFLLDPNIFLSTLDSNAISLCPSLNMTYQVAHPYKTTRKIMLLYIFIVLYSKLEDPRFCNEWQQSFPQCALNFFVTGILICHGCSQILKLFHPVKGFFYLLVLWHCPACCSRDMPISIYNSVHAFYIHFLHRLSFFILCLSPVMTEEGVEM